MSSNHRFTNISTGLKLYLSRQASTLENYLIEQMRYKPLVGKPGTEWASVEKALQHGSDLESALTVVDNQDLLKTITRMTGAFIA